MKKYSTIRNLAKIRKLLWDIESKLVWEKDKDLMESLGKVSMYTLESIHSDLLDYLTYEEVIDKLEFINKDIPKNSYFKDLLEAFKLQCEGKKYIGMKDEYAKYMNKRAKKMAKIVMENRHEKEISDLWKSILNFYLPESKYEHKKGEHSMTKRELRNYDEVSSRSITWKYDCKDDSKKNLKKVLLYVEASIEIGIAKMKYNKKYNHHMNGYIIEYICLEKEKAIKKRILKHL